MSQAREKLRAAHARKAAATEALDAARKATQAARDFLAGAERDLARHTAIANGVWDARRRQIVDAIKAGAKPAGEVPGLDAATQARLGAHAAHAAAAEAVAELDAEETDAKATLDRAVREVEDAAKAVAAAAVEAMARGVADLEARAMALRIRIGGRYGFVAASLPVSEATMQTLRESDESDIGSVNTPAWRQARASAEALRAFVADLARDADAELSFDETTVAAEAA